jgi:hypothetical protein
MCRIQPQSRCGGSTDLSSILTKNQAEPENPVSWFLRFRSLVGIENSVASCPTTTAEQRLLSV